MKNDIVEGMLVKPGYSWRSGRQIPLGHPSRSGPGIVTKVKELHIAGEVRAPRTHCVWVLWPGARVQSKYFNDELEPVEN